MGYGLWASGFRLQASGFSYGLRVDADVLSDALRAGGLHERDQRISLGLLDVPRFSHDGGRPLDFLGFRAVGPGCPHAVDAHTLSIGSDWPNLNRADGTYT